MDTFTIQNKMTVLLGKRGSGKSELCKHLIETSEPFDRIFCICPTEPVNNFYKSFINPKYIFDNWNEKFISELFKKIEKENGGKPKSEMKRVLLILDDLVGDVSFRDSKILKRIFVRSRHICLSLLILTQGLMEISPIQRNCTDFLLVSTVNLSSVETLSEQFSGGREFSKKDFVAMYYDVVKDYTFLGINNSCTKSNSKEEIYFSIKAPMV